MGSNFVMLWRPSSYISSALEKSLEKLIKLCVFFSVSEHCHVHGTLKANMLKVNKCKLTYKREGHSNVTECCRLSTIH